MEKIIKNEKQFAEWFMKNYKKLGYPGIVREDNGLYPDFVMLRDGKEVRVELELLSSNFVYHNHCLDDVDEIVCIVENVELKKPVIQAKGLVYKSDRIKVTLSIDEDTYKKFQEFCEENAMSSFKLPKPEFRFDDSFFVTLYDKTKVEKLGENIRETVGKILVLIKENPKITREELSIKTGITVRGIEWNLAKLKQKGLLKRIGPAKGGYWKVVKNGGENER